MWLARSLLVGVKYHRAWPVTVESLGDTPFASLPLSHGIFAESGVLLC